MAESTSTNQECSICQQPIGLPRDDGSTEDIITTPCGHSFGEICLRTWLNSATNCPYCRTELIIVPFNTPHCPFHPHGHTVYDVAETFVEMLFEDLPQNATRMQLASIIHLTIVRFINTVMHLNGLPDSAPELSSMREFDTWISDITLYMATFSPPVYGVAVERGVESILDFARSLSPDDSDNQDLRELLRDLFAAEDGDELEGGGSVPNIEVMRLDLLHAIALERQEANYGDRGRSASNNQGVEMSGDAEDEGSDQMGDESPHYLLVEEVDEAESERPNE